MKSLQVIRTHLSPYQHPKFMEYERHALEKLGDVHYTTLAEAKTDLATVLITNTHTQLASLDQALLRQTRLILHPNSGYDHFASEFNLWRNIPLVVGHVVRAQAVAEYTLSCLFEGLIQLPQHLMWDKGRAWDRPLISGLEIWIFGYGHIGKKVALTLHALGAKITIVDPFIQDCPFKLLRSWKEGKLSSAQAVLACSSLNSTSLKLFNQDFFENAHPKLLFINGARGKLICEKALREFLLTHPGAFAFLDVFPDEPFKDTWINFPQTWKTSHIAGVHSKLDQGIITFEVDTLSDFLGMDQAAFNHKYQQELLQNKWIKGELI